MLEITKLRILKATHNKLYHYLLVEMLLEITKLRILKATHNDFTQDTIQKEVVRDHKVTNFESNSQQSLITKENLVSC